MIAIPASRDEKGRLLPGHGLKSPGRPKREFETKKLEELRNLIPYEKFAVVVTKALEQAMEGNHQARQWISDYLLPPKQLMVQGLPSTTIVSESTVVVNPISNLIQHANVEQMKVLRDLIADANDDDSEADED